jgi:hypothetical protein
MRHARVQRFELCRACHILLPYHLLATPGDLKYAASEAVRQANGDRPDADS